jgi:hypothetical protein
MNLKHLLAGVAMLCGAQSLAHADTYNFTDITSASEVFNRPVNRNSLSGVGTAVGYDALPFSVSRSGVYSFVGQSEAFDNFTLLYREPFLPNNSLSNLVELNDDIGGNIGISGFVAFLTEGTGYVFVNTGFGNRDVGKFTASISGEGAIIPVPEPEVIGMLVLGLGVLGWVARRRRQAIEQFLVSL